jgi:hypothetical protein
MMPLNNRPLSLFRPFRPSPPTLLAAPKPKLHVL